MDNYFLNNVNKSIGDNARFARDFQANPEKYAQAKQPSATEQMLQMISPMLMMLLFEMMGRQTPAAGGSSLPSSFFAPFLNGANANDVSAQLPVTNPAVSYLDDLFKSKTPTPSPAPQAALASEDIAKVREDLASGALKTADLGQALKYQLAKAPDADLPAVQQLTIELMDNGDLNIGPFLQNDYLAQLTPERRDALLSVVKQAGLRTNDGKPNGRFIGFILDSLHRDEQPQTQALVQQFLQDFHDKYGADGTTPIGKVLTNVLDLASVSPDEQGKLIFN